MQKTARATLRKRIINRSTRSTLKTHITKAEKLISANEAEPGREAVIVAISTLDKAVGKGIIHPNNAARRKSHLMKKLHSLDSQLGEPA